MGCTYTFIRLTLDECSANDRDVLTTLCVSVYKQQQAGSIESRANKKDQLRAKLERLNEEIDSAVGALPRLPGVELYGGSVINILLEDPSPGAVDLLEESFPKKDELLRSMEERRRKGSERLVAAKVLSVVKFWLEDGSPGPGGPGSVEWDTIKKMSEAFPFLPFLVSSVPEVQEALIQKDD